ncbi:MAG: glutathione synthase [Gammaproteobacteria bacterium]|nr:MAG: glutathione synthase [Gammaproteobacteria bacterium]
MIKLGVVMDPIGSIKIHKDSTYAMLLEAQTRGWRIHYMEQQDLFLRDSEAFGCSRALTLYQDDSRWFEFGAETTIPLTDLDVILMRKDPPFNMEYLYTTYLLERAEVRGTLIVNKPQSLRDANEKLFTAWFPQCIPPTLVTSQASQIKGFLGEQQEIILKPLDTMGGASVFRLRRDDPNINVVIETLTDYGFRHVMAQRFIPEIKRGDKRILMVDGEPIPYALARIPIKGESRGNLAVGGKGTGVALSEHDHWICTEVGPTLREKGLLFVGLDVIGDYLTEINVTSPTCIRELDKLYSLNISATLMDAIANKLKRRPRPRAANRAN